MSIPMDEKKEKNNLMKNPIDKLFDKLHHKMQACQSFVTNLESFMDDVPSFEISIGTCAIEIVDQNQKEPPHIEKLIHVQKEDITTIKLLGERNDALHKEVQTLERSRFLLRRRVRECETLKDIQEKNAAVMLETQQNMLKDVSEAKSAFEKDLENLRGELHERQAQFEAKQSQLKRMKIENENLRKKNSNHLEEIARLKQKTQDLKQECYKKVNLLTAKLEGVNADLIRSKRAHIQAKAE